VGLIDSRLRRLEQAKPGNRCPECGFAPDERRPIAVVYPADEPDKGFQGDPHEACSSCKEPLHTVTRVIRDGGEGGAEGGGLT
jgi:hypothetical protein